MSFLLKTICSWYSILLVHSVLLWNKNYRKRVNTKVDNGYVLLILNQMSLQLHKYYAAITYNLKREDVDLCNARVAPVATCLQNCLLSLDKELDKFEQKVSY